VQLIRDCRSQLIIPIFVLVFPRAGDFVHTAAEHQTMIEQIHQAKDAGARGIVTGALTRTHDIDEDQTAELFEAAERLPVTFHRAFDACPDLAVALERLIHLGADRVLTSGGAPTASEGAARISRLRIQADRRIEIVAGGGIDAHNVARLVHDTAVREVHFSVRDAEKVRAVVANL
jgi:copper homeostasis protein